MTGAHGPIEVAEFPHPVKGHTLLRVTFAGWTVRVDGAKVTVPDQDITGKTIDDLSVCLQKAYSVAGVPQTYEATAGGPRLTEALIATLQHARNIANQRWSVRSRDVYRCTFDAWEHCGMAVPYTQLIRALRAALPEPTTLTDYNDHGDRAQIKDLYRRAIALLGRTSGERGVA